MLATHAYWLVPQRNRAYQYHSWLLKSVFSSHSCPWRSDIPARPYFTVRGFPSLRLAGEIRIDSLTDLLAFSFIIYLALKSGSYQSGLPNLLKVMAEDATLYFLVIFTSHLLLELTLIFGSVRTSSRRSVSPLSYYKTFTAFGQTTPRSVSASAIRLFRLFAEPLSTKQWKCRVRLTRFFVSWNSRV